jgi:hypothetical protein
MYLQLYNILLLQVAEPADEDIKEVAEEREAIGQMLPDKYLAVGLAQKAYSLYLQAILR